jgi:small-conductance mechanosensitive channel
VTALVARAGLARTTFLGLSVTDWVNLAISVFVVLVGYLLGTWLIRRLLPRVVRRTPSPIDDAILEAVGPDVRWLVVVLGLGFATSRLVFVNADLKLFLKDAYFVLGLVIAVRLVWHVIDLGYQQYHEQLAQAGRAEQLDPALILLARLLRLSVIITGLLILLSYFGINVTALAAALGVVGLAFSLAAQDTLADAISGFIILADRPFRVGDRIEIQGEQTWGDVVEIGLRTTRIRTRDNRMVIVPNSIIGKNQVINYTYPDPRYRIETHVGVAYGTDIDKARQVIIDTVREVDNVLPDKPVDALYAEMGDSAMIFRVRWWIESYIDTRRVQDRVHTALQRALDAHGIESPYPTQNLNVRLGAEGSADAGQDAQGRSQAAKPESDGDDGHQSDEGGIARDHTKR